MQATVSPPLLEGFDPFSQAAQTKFGEQMLQRHGLDGSAAHQHSPIWELHQEELTAGLW